MDISTSNPANTETARIDIVYQKLLNINTNKDIKIHKESEGQIKFTCDADIESSFEWMLGAGSMLLVIIGFPLSVATGFKHGGIWLLLGVVGFIILAFVKKVNPKRRERDLIISQNKELIFSSLNHQKEYFKLSFDQISSNLWAEERATSQYSKEYYLMLKINGEACFLPYPVREKDINNLVYFANLAIRELSQ